MSVASMNTRTPRSGILAWSSAVIALVTATMTIPPVVAQWSTPGRITVSELPTIVSTGLEQWSLAGTASPSPLMMEAVAFWAVFHLVKTILAIALLSASVTLGARVWHRAARAHTRIQRGTWITVGVLATCLPVPALLVALANIQGAIAPLSSVLSFLPLTSTPAVEQVRAELETGAYSPVTSTLLADFRTYHASLATSLAVVIAAVLATIALILVRRARQPHHNRLIRRLLAAGAITLTLLVVWRTNGYLLGS